MNLNVQGDRRKRSRESIVPNDTVGETAFLGESPWGEKWTLRARDQARRYCSRVCAGGWPGRRSPGRWPKGLQAKDQPAVKLPLLVFSATPGYQPSNPWRDSLGGKQGKLAPVTQESNSLRESRNPGSGDTGRTVALGTCGNLGRASR